MPDHSHDQYATREEVNGFGGRVDGLKERVAVQEAETKRNTEDVTKLFSALTDAVKTQAAFETDTATRFGKMETALVSSVGVIDKKVSNLKWWIMGGIGAGTFCIGIVVKFWP